jgi:putative ABC transport system permease protein
MLAACAVNLPVCLLSGLAAARRAARTSPAEAMRESRAERRKLPMIRTALGVVAAAGLVAGIIFTEHQNGPGAQIQAAAQLLFVGLVAVALLGPVLAAAVAAAARPLRAAGPAARLALAGIAALPRRAASAVIPVAMAVGLIAAIAFSNTSIAHAATAQSAAAVRASAVLQAGGPGSVLPGGLLPDVQALPGARRAAGISPVSLAVEDPALEYISGTAIGGADLA